MANVFARMFGGGDPGPPKPAPIVKPDKSTEKVINSIENLNEQEEQLEKRRALLEKRMQEQLEKAKEMTRDQKKNQALLELKKKKMYETQLDQTDNLILRVTEQRIMLENQRTTAEALAVMKGAAQTANLAMEEMNITNVAKVMEEITEQNDEMACVHETLKQGIGLAGDIDEDDLVAELAELESAVLDEDLGLAQQAPVSSKPAVEQELPSIPSTFPAISPEEEELAALEASLA